MKKLNLLVITMIFFVVAFTSCSFSENYKQMKSIKAFRLEKPLQLIIQKRIKYIVRSSPSPNTDKQELIYIDKSGTAVVKMFGNNEYKAKLKNAVSIYCRKTNAYTNFSDSFYVLTKSRELYAIGHNENGELGDGTGVDKTTFVKIPLKNIANVYFVNSKIYALTYNLELYYWGGNTKQPKKIADDVVDVGKFGYLNKYGNIYSENEYGSPDKYNASQSDNNVIKQFGGPENGNCFFTLHENGEIYGLGAGIFRKKTYVTSLPKEKLFEIKAICGDFEGDNIFILFNDNTLWGFGKNAKGYLGNRTKVEVKALTLLHRNVKDIGHFWYRDTKNNLWFWNDNNPTPKKSGININSKTIEARNHIDSANYGYTPTFIYQKDDKIYYFDLNIKPRKPMVIYSGVSSSE